LDRFCIFGVATVLQRKIISGYRGMAYSAKSACFCA